VLGWTAVNVFIQFGSKTGILIGCRKSSDVLSADNLADRPHIVWLQKLLWKLIDFLWFVHIVEFCSVCSVCTDKHCTHMHIVHTETNECTQTLHRDSNHCRRSGCLPQRPLLFLCPGLAANQRKLELDINALSFTTCVCTENQPRHLGITHKAMLWFAWTSEMANICWKETSSSSSDFLITLQPARLHTHTHTHTHTQIYP